MLKRVYIMLGRNGDIINILPVVKYAYDTYGIKPILAVAKAYKDLLDGINYADKYIYDGDFREVNKAVREIGFSFPNDIVINCSVYGWDYKYKRQCYSFQRESWHFSQCPESFGSLPLVFDNRDGEREQKFLEQFALDGRKVVLTALSGTSSPFTNANALLSALEKELDKREYRIIDISNIKAERLYDILALFETAHTLLATDSAPLNLAKAIPKLPVISLVSDAKGDDWLHSGRTKQHILRLLHSEVMNKLPKIIEAVKQGYNYRQPVIHLISTQGKADTEAERRYQLAKKSWHKERQLFGEGRWYYHNYVTTGLPKVKDLIEYAISKAETGEDIIMLTNADICLVPGLTGYIIHEVERRGAAYFHRHDFSRIDRLLKSEVEISRGKWYCGSDTFVFTKLWWQAHRDIFPDMYFAREFWDMIFRNMIKRSGGTEIHNAIYHEKHKSFWESKENRNCQENLHNKALAQRWLETYGGDWNDWKIKKPYK